MIVKSILDGKMRGKDRLIVCPDDFVSQVARELSIKRVGALVAVDPEGRVAGIISERDIVRALAQQGQAISCLRVAEVMTTEVLVCHETDHVNRLVRSMTERRVRHVPVVDADHHLIGMVTVGDVVKSLLFDELPEETEILHEYNRHNISRI